MAGQYGRAIIVGIYDISYTNIVLTAIAILLSLVIAGSLGISFEEAEALKLLPAQQPRLFPLVRPVMEKVGNIINSQIAGQTVQQITLVGGSSAFFKMAEVIAEYTGIPTRVPILPAHVTPLGLARHAANLA